MSDFKTTIAIASLGSIEPVVDRICALLRKRVDPKARKESDDTYEPYI